MIMDTDDCRQIKVGDKLVHEMYGVNDGEYIRHPATVTYMQSSYVVVCEVNLTDYISQEKFFWRRSGINVLGVVHGWLDKRTQEDEIIK